MRVTRTQFTWTTRVHNKRLRHNRRWVFDLISLCFLLLDTLRVLAHDLQEIAKV